MGQVWTGVIEIGFGLVLCFLGHSAARVVLGLWGAVIGYFGGSLLYIALYQWLGGGWIAAVPEWVFSVALALVLAWLAFAFYAVGVLMSLGAAGWALGQALAQSMHLPAWLTVVLSLLIAAGLVVAGWTLNLPRLLLILVTAVVGAGGIIDGVQVLMGSRLAWTQDSLWRSDTNTALVWSGGFLFLVVAGIVVQSRQHGEGSLRDSYGRA
jgi:Domain of unknown function (DUF4203)